MKKLQYTIFFLLITFSLGLAQVFEFPIYFEDAFGRKDTIVYGYANGATPGIDTAFGEVNIKGQPYDGLDVRIADYEDLFSYFCFLPTDDCLNHSSFNTKRQITVDDCWVLADTPRDLIMVKADVFPLKITWDSSLTPPDCGSSPILTDWFPPFWFDIGCCPAAQAQVYSMVEEQSAYFPFTGLQIMTDEGDTMNVLFFSFNGLVPTKDLETNAQNNRIVPNPVTHSFRIENSEKWEIIKLYDLQGRFIHSWCPPTLPGRELNLPDAISSGIYLLRMEGEMGAYSERIVVAKE